MNVTALVNGYHPASGLQLTAGEDYTINPEHFSPALFEEKGKSEKGKVKSDK